MAQVRFRSGCCFALAAAAGLTLIACEREDPAGDALNNAQLKLSSLSPFGTTLPAGEHKLKTYEEVIRSLQPAVQSDNATQSASASLYIAQAQMGLTEPATARAGELERSVLTQLSSIRSALGQYINYRDSANAAASYDPASDIAEIERQDKEKVDEIAKEQAAKAAIEKQVADLMAQSRAKADAARAKRQEAGALRQKVAGQTAVEGEQTLIQWQKISRDADALEVEAARLEAEADKIAPRIGEVQNTIDRLTKQRELLAEERTVVGKRAQDGRQQASDLRAKAAQTAEEIKKLADEIHTLRTGELAEVSQKAADDYNKAAGTAAKGVKELKGSAQMVVGSARQALGELLLSRGRGLKFYAQVMESLAAAGLPGADSYKSRAEEAKAQAKETFDRAFEAYQQADTAYGSAGATGEARSRLEKLNAKFIELIEASGGSRDLITSRAEPPSDAPAPEAAPVASADQSTPQGTLQILINAEKNMDFSGVADLFLTNSDEERQAIAAMVSIAPKFKRFDEAVKSKFGKSFQELASDMAGGAGMPNMGGGMGGQMDFSKVSNAADVPVQVDGDTATFTLPNNQPLVMKQRDGKWLVDLGPQGAQLAVMAPMMSGMGAAMEQLAADVEAGKFATFEEMMMAFGQKMQGLMGGMMNPGGG